MSDERERTRNHERPGNGSPSAESGANDPRREELRQRARRMLAIGGNIIDEVLSGDSTRHLERSRQRGGQ